MPKLTRVLVADDNRIVREAMRRRLSDWGIASVVASDGEEAWRILRDPSSPRIAILDWSMPGADGIELCRRVRALEADHYTYLILLTAHEGEDSIAAGFAAGADDYLFKGSSTHVLRTRLSVAERIVGVQEELLHARELLRAQARLDALTGLLNRGAGEEELERELRRVARGGGGFAVVLLDIDRFKGINDTFGHVAGDRVLAETAEVMRTVLRSEDALIRWGGEEFLMLLPETDLAGAAEAAERVRLAIIDNVVANQEGELRITASFGVAEVPTGGRPLGDLLMAADAALYRAKASGRNCVVVEEVDEAPTCESRRTLVAVLDEPRPRSGEGAQPAELRHTA
jgi:two-component system, cell cycle response regulator